MKRYRLVLAVVVGLAAIARPAGAKKMPSVAAGGVRFQVLCERCGKEKDCLSVKAAGKDAPAGKLLLSDESMCRGVGDDLTVEVSARKFTVSPALAGVLVKQETGGEAIGHNHWLVAIVDGKLAVLWNATYNTQEMVPIDSYTLKTADSDGNGRQEIDYRAPFPVSDNAATSTEAAVDTWEHQRLEFDDAKKTMVDKSPHEEFAAVLSSNKELKDALKQKVDLLKDPKCGGKDFLVLDSKTLPKLREGYYVVAGIAESRAGAQALLDRIKTCRPQISGAIRQVR
ncbi:MAG TPA: hypothetical protein VN903_32770 [Polyangia bacterium]|nr:hypothetical protein [Polyangia bacterium]